jgi:hypothetical protein
LKRRWHALRRALPTSCQSRGQRHVICACGLGCGGFNSGRLSRWCDCVGAEGEKVSQRKKW